MSLRSSSASRCAIQSAAASGRPVRSLASIASAKASPTAPTPLASTPCRSIARQLRTCRPSAATSVSGSSAARLPAPFALTPDELGDQWRNGRACLDLHIEWNGRPFGRANGEPMQFGIGELIAHAARTRDLAAGTVIGSGTVSNANYAEVGSS